MRAPINRSVTVLGTGSDAPPRVVTNQTLRDLCSGYDEEQSGDFGTWVDRVTHIQERRYTNSEETVAHMAAKAAREALDAADVKPTELDLIILATFTPAACVPGDHVLVAKWIGAPHTPSFTLTAACAGSVQGMAFAYGMLTSGMMKRILVIGAECISPTLDYTDPLTAILFGDGAGAVVMGAVDSSEGGVLPPYLGHEFNWENINMANANMPFQTTVRPAQNGSPPTIEKTYLRMYGGRSVLRNAVNTMAACTHRVLGFDDGDVPEDEWSELKQRMRVVPHQANGRIVDGLTKKLGMPRERVVKTVHRYGNVSAASNLMALDFGVRHGNLRAEQEEGTERILRVEQTDDRIEAGDLVVLPTIGAGYLYGAVAFVHAG